jgi:SAM-dependent methyltransferase
MLKNNIVNVEQAESWDGGDGDHWTEHDEMYNGAVARHHRHFLRAAAIGAADRVLDVGCGTGVSTCDAARAASSGSALGVDLSSRMLARAEARAREQGLVNVKFERADAQVHDFGRDAFDVALSRFGAMFFGDHTAALRNIGNSLRPGGRVVLMSWLPFEDNVWIRSIRDAFAAGRELPGEPSGRPGPFGLSEPNYVRSVLSGAGFTDVSLEEIREPMWFGATANDAFAFWASSGMNQGLLGDADHALRERAHASLRRLFSEHQTSEGVLLESAAWLTTARKA